MKSWEIPNHFVSVKIWSAFPLHQLYDSPSYITYLSINNFFPNPCPLGNRFLLCQESSAAFYNCSDYFKYFPCELWKPLATMTRLDVHQRVVLFSVPAGLILTFRNQWGILPVVPWRCIPATGEQPAVFLQEKGSAWAVVLIGIFSLWSHSKQWSMWSHNWWPLISFCTACPPSGCPCLSSVLVSPPAIALEGHLNSQYLF